jgi:NAD(P)-dependent dehydrogenase (short-subunit alcohol dehydrogenase family)
MKDKIVIITGANIGIGKYTAEELYKLGATIIMACRSEQKAEQAI